MSKTVISVENVSKIYRLGEIGTGSLAHDVNRWWHRVRGKEDPYLKIGQINDRTRKPGSEVQKSRNQSQESGRDAQKSETRDQQAPTSDLSPPSSDLRPPTSDLSPLTSDPASTQETSTSAVSTADYVYALKDISFEVKQGEVLGIIGRNGAGKSTLLKILSRVTKQTSGRIRVKGRIASLLEVGTGFHPELTGRENIFLNGAILGMRKAEISAKFDEIVDFSGCERYIDTPVKRYSSGMYVRLAFAVAAHLEPEILIVDEVLAVGDADFQKKCLGKMKDVAGQGRTVLFVSHNLGAVAKLCHHALLLAEGMIVLEGATNAVLQNYLSPSESLRPSRLHKAMSNCLVTSVQTMDVQGTIKSEFFMGESITLLVKLSSTTSHERLEVGINIKDSMEDIISHVSNLDDGSSLTFGPEQLFTIKVTLLSVNFCPGNYTIDIALLSRDVLLDSWERCCHFSLSEGPLLRRGSFPSHVRVFTPTTWEYNLR